MGAPDGPYRIGVLITYFNEGPLLMECLTSLKQNSDQPDEIWIHDSGSDVPAAMYVPAGMNVRIVRGQALPGPSHDRNVLLRRCTCDYVHFQDADDTFAPEWCAAVRNLIQRDKPDVVFTEIATFRDGRLLCSDSQHLCTLSSEGDLLRFCIRYGLWTQVGTYLRERVEEIGGYDEQCWLTEDYNFHIRFATLRPRYRIIFDPLIRYSLRDDSRSARAGRKRICVDAAKYLRSLRTRLPDAYQSHVSEQLAIFGAELYSLGAHREAAEVFAASCEIVRPRYEGHRLAYRIVARLMGQSCAEWCSHRLPVGVR